MIKTLNRFGMGRGWWGLKWLLLCFNQFLRRGKQVGRLESGEPVFDATPSHLEGHPTVLPHIEEALLHINGQHRAHLCVDVDLGHIIGKSLCIRTKAGDEIVYAQRQNRKGLTRFVKNRVPEDSRHVTIALTRVCNGYVLDTAYVGRTAPAEPWDTAYATEESVLFWNTHALVWGYEKTVSGTETSVRPW